MSGGGVPARQRWAYALALAVVAPFVAETVASSNTPASRFLLALPLHAVLYGVPALLLREAWVRGRLGWPGVVAAGTAYTALNEGLVAATWFRLSPDDRVLAFTAAQAGHAAGVNWAPAVGLVVFHTVYSLVLPVVFVQAWAGPLRDAPWLRRPGLAVCTALLALLVLGSLTPEATERVCAGSAAASCREGRWVAVAILVLFVVVAAALPRWRPTRRQVGRPPGDVALLGAGCAFGLVFFVAYFALPLAGVPVVAVVAEVLLAATAALVVARWSRRGGWGVRSAVLLGAGALVPGALSSFWHPAALQPLAAAVAVVLLWLLLRRLRVDATPTARP